MLDVELLLAIRYNMSEFDTGSAINLNNAAVNSSVLDLKFLQAALGCHLSI